MRGLAQVGSHNLHAVRRRRGERFNGYRAGALREPLKLDEQGLEDIERDRVRRNTQRRRRDFHSDAAPRALIVESSFELPRGNFSQQRW